MRFKAALTLGLIGQGTFLRGLLRALQDRNISALC